VDDGIVQNLTGLCSTRICHINEFDYDVTDDSGDSQLMSSMSVKKNGNAEVDDTNPKLDRK